MIKIFYHTKDESWVNFIHSNEHECKPLAVSKWSTLTSSDLLVVCIDSIPTFESLEKDLLHAQLNLGTNVYLYTNENISGSDIARMSRKGFSQIVCSNENLIDILKTNSQSINKEVYTFDSSKRFFTFSYNYSTKKLSLSDNVYLYTDIPKGISTTKKLNRFKKLINTNDFSYVEHFINNLKSSNHKLNIKLQIQLLEGKSWFLIEGIHNALETTIKGIGIDINKEKYYEAKLINTSIEHHKAKVHLKNIERLSKVTTWRFNTRSKRFSWGSSLSGLINLPDEALSETESLLKLIHPSDVNYFKKSIYPALEKAQQIDADFRIVIKDHGTIFVRMTSFDQENTKRSTHFIQGTIQDISSEKEFNLKLTAQNKKLEEANKNSLKRAQELEKAKLAAEESDQLKSAFLSNMSHEIRTPISSISGFTELLKSDNLQKDQKERFINLILGANKQLLKIFNDMIELSKISSNQLTINHVPTNINRLLTDLQQEFALQSTTKNIPVVLKLSPEMDNKELLLDASKIFRVMSVFIDNAIKFTNEGSVTLSYQKKEKYVEFYIEDTGIGIPQKKIDKIFTAFTQADDTLSRNYHGTGIGLTIAQGIIDKMNGKVCIDSVENEGTTITMILPIVHEDDIVNVSM